MGTYAAFVTNPRLGHYPLEEVSLESVRFGCD